MERIEKTNGAYFFIGYSLFLFFSLLSTSFFYQYYSGTIYLVIKTISLVFLIMHESNSRNWKREDLLLLSCASVMVLIMWSCGIGPTNELVMVWPFAFCARNLDFTRIAKVSIKVSLVALLLIIISAQLGIIENYISQRGYLGIYRSYLGFRYSLFGPFVFLNIVTLYMYVSRGKKNILQLLLCFVFASYLYIMTDSRLAYVLTLLVIIIGFALNYKWKKIPGKSYCVFCMKWAFVVSAMISLVISIMYRPDMPILRDLNLILGNRLALGHEAISQYGFTLFGQEIEWIGNGLDEEGLANTLKYNYVDSFYLQFLLNFGVVASGMLITLLTIVQMELYKAKNYVGMMLMSVVALHGIIDDLIKYLHYNAFLLLIGMAFIAKFGYNYSNLIMDRDKQ